MRDSSSVAVAESRPIFMVGDLPGMTRLGGGEYFNKMLKK